MASPHAPSSRPLMGVEGRPGAPLFATIGDPPSAAEVRAVLWLAAGTIAAVLAAVHSLRLR